MAGFKKTQIVEIDPGGQPIDFDLLQLGSIKTVRTLKYPVIVHQPTQDWTLLADHQIYGDIKLARIRQNMESPVHDRIKYATWPETVLYFPTLTMDVRFATRDVKELYQYSIGEYLDEWSDIDPDERPHPLSRNRS